MIPTIYKSILLISIILLLGIRCKNILRYEEGKTFKDESDKNISTDFYQMGNKEFKYFAKSDFNNIQQICNADYDKYAIIDDSLTKSIRINIEGTFACKHFTPIRANSKILLGEFTIASMKEWYTYLVTCDTSGNVTGQLIFKKGEKRNGSNREISDFGYIRSDSLIVYKYNYIEKKDGRDSVVREEDLWIITEKGEFVQKTLKDGN